MSKKEQKLETATFAGGCFWCMVKPFKATGVRSVTAGYAGGHVLSPTYEQICSGTTGHREVIQVIYDANIVDYRTLLDIFWQNIDPFDAIGQFADKGFQYTSAIYVHDDDQRRLAEESLAKMQSKFRTNEIQTKILNFTNFYPAEDYHQDYYQKQPEHYEAYYIGSGRKFGLKRIWE
ncbi:MAG: peptide-methionine (S)-S-oxide reductase MsrA [Alphaproteobacteria bacterium]